MARGERTMPHVERLVYSVPEVAAMLGISERNTYERIRRGEIPSIRIGGRVLVPRVLLEAMVNGNVPVTQDLPTDQ